MSKETDEERKKRWAANAAKSFMTPQMMHAMNMSSYQSQNKYKAAFEKSKAKGYTAVSSTPELEHVRMQSERMSVKKYKHQFEANKSKYTQVADDPELQRLKKMTELSSQAHYKGKNAIAQSKRRPRDQNNGESPKIEEKVAAPVINEEEKHVVEQTLQEVENVEQGIGDYGPGANDQHQQEQYEQESYPDADNAQMYDDSNEDVEQDNTYETPPYDQDQTQGYSENTDVETGGDYNQYLSEDDAREQQTADDIYDIPANDNPAAEDEYEEFNEDGGNLDDFYATLN